MISGTKLNRTIVMDSREQCGWFQEPGDDETAVVCRGLRTGDYALEGLEHLLLIERKSLSDLCACVGRERGRFERELARMSEVPHPWLFIEATIDDTELSGRFGRVAPSAVVGSVLGWAQDFDVRPWWGGSPTACRRAALSLFGSLERRVERGAVA